MGRLAEKKLGPGFFQLALTRKPRCHPFEASGPGLRMLGPKGDGYMKFGDSRQVAHPTNPVVRQHDVLKSRLA